jgi:hypothetical protein
MYDSLFKDLITAGWNVSSDGHVEAPQGFFAIVEIPSHPGELRDMMEALDSMDYDWPEAGWYFTVENSDGIIFVYRVDKAAAEILFEAYAKAYAEWDAT